MKRRPLSTEPIDKYFLYKGAYSNWFLVVLALTLLGFAIKILKPESIILALIGMIFFYMFVESVTDGLEISTMNRKIRWYRNYSILTYLSGALFGFLLPFESTKDISLLIAFPVLVNACLIWPQITVNAYKKNYTELFGVIDA